MKLSPIFLIIPAVALLLALPQASTQAAPSPMERHLIITKPGAYNLTEDLVVASTDAAILVQADNVTVDLRGHSVMGPGSKLGVGIEITGNNVRVMNGTVMKFGLGVKIADSNNVAIEKLQISGEDLGGAPPDIEIGVMIVNSRGVKLADNVISKTFLGVFVRGDGSGANTIKGNTLAGGDNGQLGICYNPAPNGDPAVDGPQGDLVSSNHISRYKTGISTSPASVKNIFSDNYISYFDKESSESTPGSNVFMGNVSTQL